MQHASLNISVPESMKAFVETQMAKGGYSTASEYVRSLIREAARRSNLNRLEELITEGLESGQPIELTEKAWNERRERLVQRHTKSKST